MTNDRFRTAIDFHFGDRSDVKSKFHLSVLMRRRGFFNASVPEKRMDQAKLLIDDAWESLKSEGVVTDARQKPYFEYISSPKGFVKRQIRDSKGRIVGWIK